MNKDAIILLSPPQNVDGELEQLIQLFEAGLQRFHLRKPNFSDIDLAQYLAQIPSNYWSRIILHQHYHLAVQLGLGGIHLTERSRKDRSLQELIQLISDFKAEGLAVSAAIHTLDDLSILGNLCDYVLISPVFDSISKSEYKANPHLNVNSWKSKVSAKLIALGGIQPDTFPVVKAKGFDGVAVLGYIWQQPNLALEKYNTLLETPFETLDKTKPTRPFVLTIAGHDPSAGAGLTADIKAFEQNEVYGLSVCTALTVQDDQSFTAVEWMDQSIIIQQIDILKQRFDIRVVKIGLIENWQVLEKVVALFGHTLIIFDPILKASAGFEFHKGFPVLDLLKKIHLITPNQEEILKILPASSAQESAQQLSQYCAVLLKGGHSKEQFAKDQLWQQGALIATFSPNQIAKSGKHGSGCVLSAAIAAQLARGEDIKTACQLGKQYVERFLNSNETLLGYHTW